MSPLRFQLLGCLQTWVPSGSTVACFIPDENYQAMINFIWEWNPFEVVVHQYFIIVSSVYPILCSYVSLGITYISGARVQPTLAKMSQLMEDLDLDLTDLDHKINGLASQRSLHMKKRNAWDILHSLYFQFLDLLYLEADNKYSKTIKYSQKHQPLNSGKEQHK